jgi:putative ABC transport system permease protein
VRIWTHLLAGVRALIRKEPLERELDDELQDYLDRAATEKMRSGMGAEEARRRAKLEMGGIEAVKQEVRSGAWERHLEDTWSDLRFGARLLRSKPTFAVAAIVSLSLGIGANTAIFQLLDAVRLRSLPVRSPEEIAQVAYAAKASRTGNFSTRYPNFTYAIWQQVLAKQQGFSGMAAWGQIPFNVSPAGEVRNVQGLWVSGGFFGTLGVRPALGRLLTEEDDRPACSSAGAVLSHSYWQREYGGRSDVLGQKVTVNRHPFPILGVAAPGFYGVEVGRTFDVALPLCAEEIVGGGNSMLKSRIAWWLAILGRLKPGWTLDRAAAQMQAVSPAILQSALPAEYNPSNTASFLALRLTAIPGGLGVSELRETYEAPLWLLLALAGLVLLIASANLANLMLARASSREREMGMRLAIGAGRWRLLRQLLTESLLLSVIGGSLGGLLAGDLSRVLVASLSTTQNPFFVDLETDWRVVGFTSALTVLTCILFGLAPALRATRVSPATMIREGGRGISTGRSRLGLRQTLVVSQVALSLTLLVGALLFARSLSNLTTLDPGFRRDGILVAEVDFSARDLPDASRSALSEDLLRQVRTIPGVEAASMAAIVPLSGDGIGHDILVGDAAPPEGDAPTAAFNYVSPGYFETLQTPLLSGRDFDDHDRSGSPNVAIVNETFVKKFAHGGDPMAMTFRVRRLRKISEPYQVIGVVRDAKYGELREEPFPIVYTARAQTERPLSYARILIRSRAPLASTLAAVRNVVRETDASADLVFTNFGRMVDDGMLGDRLMARLSGFFGVLAVLLAVVGLYGVTSYGVERRRSEIGIRMALGADRREVVALILREAAWLFSMGLVVGVALALAAGRAAASMLFALKPNDGVSFILAIGALAVAAFSASILPALRASRLDPMLALRDE